jgi:hypothetical protein
MLLLLLPLLLFLAAAVGSVAAVCCCVWRMASGIPQLVLLLLYAIAALAVFEYRTHASFAE